MKQKKVEHAKSDDINSSQNSLFSKETFTLLKGLAKNNNSEWFNEHKDDFGRVCIEPMLQLLKLCAAEAQEKGISLKENQKKSIFRMNRDVRFSNDKSPYKTHLGGVLSRNGTKNDNGLVYLHIEPGNSFCASGFWQPDTQKIQEIRHVIAQQEKKFLGAIAYAEKRGLKFEFETVKLQRIPKGFEKYKETKIEEFLKMKSIILIQKIEDKTIASGDYFEEFKQFIKGSQPFLELFFAEIRAMPVT